MRILLVEDDPMIADAVKSALADEAHAVDHVSSGRTALTQLGLSDYQLVLLDLGLPGLDGMSVLRTLRGEGSAKNDIPVIILTARDALEDRLNGLDAGADDYLVKPFHMSELLARMRAVMRRRNGAAANVLSNGDLSLSEAAKTVERAGQTYTLTKREYALFQPSSPARAPFFRAARLKTAFMPLAKNPTAMPWNISFTPCAKSSAPMR